MNPRTGKAAVVRLERTLRAPPHKVYRAWLEPAWVQRWMAPGAMEATRVEVDERAGGHYRVWQSHAGVDGGGFDGELVELVPDQRIVVRLGFVGPQRRSGPAYDSLLTITLREAPGGFTHLTLVHERLDALAAAMPEVAKQVGLGWELVLDKLDDALGARVR